MRLFRVVAVSVLVLVLQPMAALAAHGRGSRAPLVKAHVTHGSRQARNFTATRALLAPGSGYNGPSGSARVRALQRRLTRAGDTPGAIDGRYGPLTEQAVRRFQAAHGLEVDGISDPNTIAALSAPTLVLYPGTGYQPGGSARVRVLQHRLARADDTPGAIDGRYGPLTQRAVTRFQAAHGLQVDGIAGWHTLRALRAAEPRLARNARPQDHPAPRTAIELRQRHHRAPHRHPRSAPGQPAPPGHPATKATHPVQREPKATHPVQREPKATHSAQREPGLPVTSVLLALAALGLATMLLSYARTVAVVHRTQATVRPPHRHAADRLPADRPELAGVHRGGEKGGHGQ